MTYSPILEALGREVTRQALIDSEQSSSPDSFSMQGNKDEARRESEAGLGAQRLPR